MILVPSGSLPPKCLCRSPSSALLQFGFGATARGIQRAQLGGAVGGDRVQHHLASMSILTEWATWQELVGPVGTPIVP